jgi:hypothetical protein
MLTQTVSKFAHQVFRNPKSVRVCASVVALLSLFGQTLFIGSATVAAQGQQTRSSSKAKESKKKKSQAPVQSIGTYAIPQSSEVQQNTAQTNAADVTPPPSTTQKQVVSVTREQSAATEGELQPQKITLGPASIVDFRTLSAKTKSNGVRITGADSKVQGQTMPAPGSIEEVGPPVEPILQESTNESDDIPGPLLPSPTPSSNFAGEPDRAKTGTGIFTIPPDTMGAVGFDKVVSYVNNNLQIQDKTTGAQLSVVSPDTFWASTTATGVFDPRIQFDPYNNRWIVVSTSNPQTATSSILVGVSNTADPQGTYTLFRIVVGCAPGSGGCNALGEWADFPMLGFNKNWIAIGWNQFTINTSAFIAGKVVAIDYPAILGGSLSPAATIFTNASAATGFCMHPATTFSSTEATLYVPAHQQSAGAFYRLHKITGTPSSPIFTLDATMRVRPGGGWTQPGGDNLPQQCIPGVSIPTQTCPATPRGLDASDAFIRSNVVFRNGKIYYAQSIALPAGGLTVGSRFAAQWTGLNPDGTFFDGGRVEDPTAQIFNGGKHYSYASLSVNKNNDILMGFSEYESDDYVDAGYTFRSGTDAAGTMRDPVIFKEGEDYYQKTFSGTRNRWGDYSHTVVDPVNDGDFWTIGEYARPRVGTTGQGSNDSRWGTWWAKIAAPAGPGDLIISEFRLRGPSGANDEFVEIFNPRGSPLTVATADGSSGYSLVASDGTARFTIPNGTVIPARGHYLGVNSVAYSLASYPAGNGTTATGDATYTTDIPDNAGIALFNSSTTFTLANRVDAAGSTSEANTLYKEGTGYPALTPFSIDYSFYRSFCPNNTGVFGTAMGCTPGGGAAPKDTNDNSQDFVFADTNGTSAGAGQRLAAPGPENLSSPIERNSGFGILLVDSTVSATVQPNRFRDPAGSGGTFGSLEIRRRVVNTTGAPVTRLRFRIIDINTFPAPAGFADLRARTSVPFVFVGINDAGTCSPAPTPCTITIQGTTLEQPPSQPNGGAFNSSYSAGTITLATPLLAGASVNVNFLLGVQQTGQFRFFINVEALP